MVCEFRFCLTGETSKKGSTSGGLPYRVNRGLILCEIKIGQGAEADGTHVGRRRVLQKCGEAVQRAAVQVEYFWEGRSTHDVIE